MSQHEDGLPKGWVTGWAARPGAAVFVDAGSDVSVTAAEVEETSAAVAGSFFGGGLRPGDRIAWMPGNPLDAACTAIAALRAGLVLVAVNPQASERELAHVLRAARPAAMVRPTDGGALPALENRVAAALEVQIAVSRTDSADLLLDAAGAADPALVLFSSGTTGLPKGALHTHASLRANAAALREAWRWTEDDRLVHCLPMFHAHGFAAGLLGSLQAGGTAVFLPRFGASEVLQAAADHKATMFFGVPTMYHRLAATGRAGELARFRLTVSGSAPLPRQLHEAVTSVGGPAILERYGTTETLMAISNPYEGERRPGSIGLPLPGMEARLVPDASGRGDELQIRGPSLFEGYLPPPAEPAEGAGTTGGGAGVAAGSYGGGSTFDGPWYRTGDLAAVDGDGYFRVLGRLKELVISGGFNVYPAEVEGVLAEHAGVAEVAVAGIPSDEWGETVAAWVVPAPGWAGREDELCQALANHARATLAPYKRPRSLFMVTELKRNALGKLLRFELATDRFLAARMNEEAPLDPLG